MVAHTHHLFTLYFKIWTVRKYFKKINLIIILLPFAVSFVLEPNTELSEGLANLKLNKGVTKYILKKACSKILPPKIVNRSKKGFGVPIGEWFANGKLDFVPKFDLTKRFLSEHKSGKRDNRLALFAEYMLKKSS